jgi:hypothetical protein
MRESGVSHEAYQSLGAAAEVEGPPPDEVTTTVSAATMRRLAARSAKDRAERTTDAPDHGLPRPRSSVPSFFGKSGAVLVIPEAKSRVVPERESVPRGSQPEAPVTATTPAFGLAPERSAFRAKAPALLSDSERRRQTNRRSARSSLGRLLIVASCALLFLVLIGELWGRNVGGIREQVAARAPAVKALLERGTALLSQ